MHHHELRGGIELSDQQLLGQARQGDGTSFGRLAERWRRRIFGFIYRYVGNREEARDLTQDTFVKAFQNLGRLQDPARFSSWLYTIALNECRMRFRRQPKGQAVSLEVYLEHEELQESGDSPEGALVAGERVRILRECVRLLPEEQRVVILMKEYQGLRFHEIAEILELPLSTVKSRLYLALRTLRVLMEKRL